MIDIVRFNVKNPVLGFTKVFNFNEFKIVEGGDDKKNRKVVEDKNVDILLSPEKTRDRDFMHSRNSGLNQVLCKLAKKNDIANGFDFNLVLNSKNRGEILGRMMQNVGLCRKYKNKMVLLSGANNELDMRNPKDLVSFGIVLGMTPKEAKNALNFKRIK